MVAIVATMVTALLVAQIYVGVLLLKIAAIAAASSTTRCGDESDQELTSTSKDDTGGISERRSRRQTVDSSFRFPMSEEIVFSSEDIDILSTAA
jgi:hypothetical protein